MLTKILSVAQGFIGVMKDGRSEAEVPLARMIMITAWMQVWLDAFSTLTVEYINTEIM